MPQQLTCGEKLFHEYLTSQALSFEFEKSYEGKSKHPDYTVSFKGKEFLFEVKDFKIEDSRITRNTVGMYDPFGPIREKINEARKKFKEYKDWCCALVLWSNYKPLIHLTDGEIMFAVMEGDLGFTAKINKETGDLSDVEPKFCEGGIMIRPDSNKPQNTTISALITLRYVYDQNGIPPNQGNLGVIVWENRFARIPFPQDFFRGPYDERYRFDGQYIVKLFIGSKLES